MPIPKTILPLSSHPTSFILELGDKNRKAPNLSKGRRYLKIHIFKSENMIVSFSLAVLGLRVVMCLSFGQ